jgi:hypothetical protein
MSIGEKATDFAGLPVIEYEPATGLVLPIMPPVALRHPTKPDESWSISLERRRVTVHGDGKARTLSHATPEAAQRKYSALLAVKIGEGWRRPEGETRPEPGSLREALLAAVRDDPDDAASRNALLDYLSEHGEALPPAAYRVEGERWRDDGFESLKSFLADPAVGLVEALVVGCCWGSSRSVGSAEAGALVGGLVAARGRLPRLRALFLGDITWRELEISWIRQTDITPLFKAFPNLEHFRSRGGNGLVLNKLRHERLKSLVIEASDLPREVVLAVGKCELPALEHLEIWTGTADYGANTRVGDLKGVFEGKRLPALRHLGLRNSELTDDIARALAKAPLLERVRSLDLSLGTLTDVGAERLLAIPAIRTLERLDIHHHSVSPEMVARLRALGVTLDASGDMAEEYHADDYRYVAHSE